MDTEFVRRGLLLAIVAAAFDVAILLAARAADIVVNAPVPFMDTEQMPWFVVAIVAALGGIGATVLADILRRVSVRLAPTWFAVIVGVGAPLSAVPLIGLGLSLTGTLTLAFMHVVTGLLALMFLLPPLRSARTKVTARQ